jgi:ribonuclease HII
MVAAEAFHDTEMTEELFLLELPDTMSLSVKEVQDLLRSLESPEPALLGKLARDPRQTVRKMAYRGLRKGGSLARNENLFRRDTIREIAGADEAGRGALAGPIVAAAVVFEPGVVIKGVNDSKLLTPEQREELYEEITLRATGVSVSFVDAPLIDRWGIQVANMKALGDAVMGIHTLCQCVICDHFTLRGLPVVSFGIPKADATFQSVAAASIVAKVERDRVMCSLHLRFPYYNWINNKGYATSEHMSAIEEFGHCEVHRQSFSGVLPSELDETLWDEEEIGDCGDGEEQGE